MRQKGLFSRTIESENDKVQVQAYIGEIGDIITDIQLGLLVAVRSNLTVCTPLASKDESLPDNSKIAFVGDRYVYLQMLHLQNTDLSQSQICCCKSFILVKTLRTKGVSRATTVESAPLACLGPAPKLCIGLSNGCTTQATVIYSGLMGWLGRGNLRSQTVSIGTRGL